jgi:hypothetical protein
VNRTEIIASLKQIQELTTVCLEAFEEKASLPKSTRAKEPRAGKVRASPHVAIDLSQPFRPFAKNHVRGRTGPQKFTLVLAYLAKGNVKAEIKLDAVMKSWSKVKGFLGEFNFAHPTRAKDNGWVDSAKQGVYTLRPDWTEILRGDG